MEAEPALTPRCGEPEERGDERAGAGRADWGAGTRQRALPPPAPLRQLQLWPALPAPENEAFGPCQGRCGSRARGGWLQPALLRAPGTSVRPGTGTGFGAEFATHLKVARNWALPNPRSPPRGAGAERPRGAGRGQGGERPAP